jgi:lysophospholipase L1-like esterase
MLSLTRRPWPWLAFCLLLTSSAGARETEVMMLSGNGPEDAVPWEFMVTGGRRAGEWTTIPVPSCWEQHGFGTYNYGVHHRPGNNNPNPPPPADEQGKYRHEFTVPAEWSDLRVRIVFEGSMTDTEVAINGKSAGPVHQGSFYRFQHDITELLNIGGANKLEVTVSKKSANESVNRAERIGDYWIFGGIFRPVWLEARPAQSIEWTGIDARHDGKFVAEVHLDGKLSVTARLEARIEERDGTPVGEPFSVEVPAGADVARLETTVEGISPWTAETPHLYRASFKLSPLGSDISHGVPAIAFGFRTFEVRPEDGLYLNGSKIILKGVNRHCFNADTGRTISREQSYADARLIKEMNMNAVRMSHYQPDKHFLEACDELGLYVLNELAGWQGSYDTPTGTRLIGQLVRRDVNHPSILFWDNGNEGGWNTEVDGEFAKWDIQKRPVLHPWAKFSGIDTDHYEVWDSHLNLTRGPMIYMPTEFLHGLYDGGIGAGMRDYWDAMQKSPTVAGGFFWVFADEGVARTDRDGAIDNAGNLAPDGIVGPRGEREGSFYTVKEIWSPVQIDLPEVLPDSWDGRLAISNGYDFTRLDECSLRWLLLKDEGADADELTEIAAKVVPLPAIDPRTSGEVQLELPADWREADVLPIEVRNPRKELLWTWTSHVAAIDPGTPSGSSAAGPPSGIGAKLIAYKRDDRKFVPIEVPADSLRAEWHDLGDGAWRLDYSYELEGEFDIAGIQLLPPGTGFETKRWLGRGPYRVWQNRMEGGVLDVHRIAWNDSTPGETFEYPEFTGFFRDWRWLALHTSGGQLTIENASGVPFFGLGRVRDGVHGLLEFPDVGLAFLNVIPAMRNKFHSTEQLGPQSQRRRLSGTQSGTLIVHAPEQAERITLGSGGVDASIIYGPGVSHGFEPGAELTYLPGGGVVGEAPFYFTARVTQEGNWRVTVRLLNPGDAPVTMTVKAELRRLMVEEVSIPSGGEVTRSFIVNTRTPRIEARDSIAEGMVDLKRPREAVDEAWAWDDAITLEFNGEKPAVRSVTIEPVEVPTVFLIGDSTVCDQHGEPYNSWGQMLPRFFDPDVAIANHAESGETYRDSIGRRRLDKIISVMKPGDWLFMQFGHNDQKQIAAGTGDLESYKKEMREHIDAVKRVGGKPVVISPVERRRFDENGKIFPSLADYARASQEVAESEGVPFIDLNAMSVELYEALGPEKSALAFAAPEGRQDNTHHNNYGSYQLALCVVQGIREQQLDLARFIAPDVRDFDPSRPDPLETFAVPASPNFTNQRPLGD